MRSSSKSTFLWITHYGNQWQSLWDSDTCLAHQDARSQALTHTRRTVWSHLHYTLNSRLSHSCSLTSRFQHVTITPDDFTQDVHSSLVTEMHSLEAGTVSVCLMKHSAMASHVPALCKPWVMDRSSLAKQTYYRCSRCMSFCYVFLRYFASSYAGTFFNMCILLA
jgi:hypothetical protein